MSWQPEVDELKRRIGLAQSMGGPANVERQHAGGKLTIRERLDRLVDAGTFHETGALTGKPVYEDGKLVSITEAKLDGLRSPFRTAEGFGVEEIIDPRDTRPLLCDWVRLAYDTLPASLGPTARALRP